MARAKKDELKSGSDLPKEATESIEESDADSAALTSEREDEARKELDERQEEAREDGVTFDGDHLDPAEREIDLDSLTDDEREALERQDEVASPDYEPKGYDDYLSESRESPDINEDAKEFQLDHDRPDEFTGPEAADEAARTGVNPRSLATSSDPEGLAKESDQLAPVSENAGRVSKSSTNESPRSINK